MSNANSEAALTARTLNNNAKKALNTNTANRIKKHNTIVNGKQYTTSVSNSPAALQATTNNQTLVTVNNKKGKHYVLVEKTKNNGNNKGNTAGTNKGNNTSNTTGNTPISPEASSNIPPPPTEPHPNNEIPSTPNTPPPNVPINTGKPASQENLNKARKNVSNTLKNNKNAVANAQIPPPPPSDVVIPNVGSNIGNNQLGGRRKSSKRSKKAKKSRSRTRRQRK